MKKIILLLGILIVSQAAFSDSKKAITIENARIRAVPAASPNSGGFMLIKNDSGAAVNLIKAESDISESVELHNMIMTEGVMKMRPVDKIEIPANGSVELKPGSFHIMFIGLKAPLQKDQKKTVTLHFSNGQKEILEVPVVEIMMKKK